MSLCNHTNNKKNNENKQGQPLNQQMYSTNIADTDTQQNGKFVYDWKSLA